MSKDLEVLPSHNVCLEAEKYWHSYKSLPFSKMYAWYSTMKWLLSWWKFNLNFRQWILCRCTVPQMPSLTCTCFAQDTHTSRTHLIFHLSTDEVTLLLLPPVIMVLVCFLWRFQDCWLFQGGGSNIHLRFCHCLLMVPIYLLGVVTP